MDQPSQNTSRNRLWLRRGLYTALFIIGVLGIALWIITRSWFIVAQIKPELAARLGGDVSIASASYEGGGRFILRDVVLRVPAHIGDAGEVLRVSHARVRVDERRLVRGDVRLEDIELDGVILRLAEDVKDAGAFTFMDLHPQWNGDESAVIAALPRLEIRNAMVEYGTHGEDGYAAHGRRHLAGLMEPDPKAARAYNLHLSEIDETGEHRSDGISVQGTWNVETNEHSASVGGLVLDQTAHDMVPQAVHWWWNHLGLEGRLANARIDWREGRPLSIAFDIENVGITLPVETDQLWARYHAGQVIAHSARPRLRVHSGTIRFEENAIKLDDLIGELRSEDMIDDGPVAVSVPYNVKVSIRDLRPVDWDDREAWINHMLVTVPFEMEFSITDFSIAPDADGNLPPVDLPLPVAQALERFLLTDFTLSTRVEVKRDEQGTLTTGGRVYISGASGAYEQFPYPLRGIDATISFEGERVQIESLQGRAPSGALVNIQGTIDSLGREAEVDLRLTTDRTAVDEHLRSAMRFKNLAFVEALMNIPAEQALRASGRLDAASDEQSEEDADHRAEGRAPFQLGGDVALDLRIHRAAGPNQPTDITGDIDIHSVGVVYEHFPYPFTVTGGLLRLETNGVSIIEDEHGRGLSIVTAGGGGGFVKGSVRTRRTENGLRVLPDLTIEVENDRMNSLITAAIPLGRGKDHQEESEDGAREPDEAAIVAPAWPGGVVSKPVALLESAGLSGALDYSGRVFFDDEGQVRYEFTVDLRGQARPGAELAAILGEAGLIWPPDLIVSGLEAQVNVTDGEVTLVRFDGDHDHGQLSATGTINWLEDEARTELDIELIDLELGHYLVDLMPSESIDAVAKLWDRYQPSGSFSVKLEFRSRGENFEPPRLLIDPTGVRLLLDDEAVVLSREAGGLTLRDGRVSFDELALVFLRDEGATSDGSVRFNGSYGLNAGGDEAHDLTIHAVWSDGRFESPLIVEAMRLIGAESHIREFERLNPRGLFNADFSFTSATGDRPSTYGLSLQPRTLLIDLGDSMLEAELHEDSRISFGDNIIDIHRLGGTLGGEVFSLQGSIDTGAQMRIALEEIAFDGRLMNEQIQSILPQGVRDLFEKIKFVDGPRTMVEGGRLLLAQRDRGEGGRWDTSFSGVVRTSGASFSTGMKVSQLDGTITILFEEGSNDGEQAAPRLEIDVHGESLMLADRRIANLRAPGVTLSEDGRSLLVPEVVAEIYGGLLWAEADIGLAEGQPYEARLELVGTSAGGLMTGDAQASRNAGRSRRQGSVNAGVRLAGVTGQPESRTGRGVIRAVGGSLENVPFVLQLMQVLQLTLPLRGALDNAHVEVLIDGETAIFERILLESTLGDLANLQLFGEGQMNLRTLELRTQFRSRGGTLLIRDLVGGIGDQLYAIEIVGTLGKPRARIVPLPGLTQQPAARPRLRSRETAAVVGGDAR